MTRVKRAKIHLKKRRVLKKMTKGYKWTRKSNIRQGRTAVLKAGLDAFKGRKEKKRTYRRLWTVRISAALKPYDLSYSRFIDKLKKAKVEIDRKMLADLALSNPKIFEAIVNKVK